MTTTEKPAEGALYSLSRVDSLALAWKRFTDGCNPDMMRSLPLPPEPRQHAVGAFVEIGNLKNCQVLQVSACNRFFAVEYSMVKSKDCQPLTPHSNIGVFSWTSCFPLQCQDTDFARKSLLRPNYLHGDVKALVDKVFIRGVVDNPDYQRDYVWTSDDKTALIESIFSDRSIGAFLFIEYPDNKHQGKLEVLDGKQRLNAIIEFYSSKFPYQGVYFHELSRRDRRRFLDLDVQFAHLDAARMSRADILKTFLEVNFAGVPQTQQHLKSVQKLLNDELSVTAEEMNDSEVFIPTMRPRA